MAEDFEAEFERLGLKEVKARINNNIYGPVSMWRAPAQDWVYRKELELADEQARAASLAQAAAVRASEAADRAADAAERQAATAERATRTAIAALVISIVVGIFSLVAASRK
jgi:hypothetical protein